MMISVELDLNSSLMNEKEYLSCETHKFSINK